ncbi:MAG TPA: beta-L-arabinofuranosidase domain-containing protein, partial [Chthonomonadales bacterium]|nr:beta-L-arabinofuranosidase domain-containing protein [Chthonomonadales bacterium]
NFRRAAGKSCGPFNGIFFNDSDVSKWLEAASYALAAAQDDALEQQVDSVIDAVAAAQQPDGYLNTYFMFDRASERWTNLQDMHEIYCAGHLIQAAVAHHRATGKKSLLEVAERLAGCLYEVFGPGKREGACGHEEAEMALVELYRETRDSRWLQLAELMIDRRGTGLFGGSAYFQDQAPFTHQTQVTGHAVRQMYLCCGAADVFAETGRPDYLQSLEALWHNFTTKRMYVTGGAGSRYEGEAFGEDYELPNDRAYSETCAAIGSVMWNWRMLNITGECRYADLMEHTLYNAALPGISLDGRRYFYQNPLSDSGRRRRQEWFGCACCPPNIARLFASLPGYFYSVSNEGAYVHLYSSGSAELELPGGESIRLTQSSDYPWNGSIKLRVGRAPARDLSLFLRIPGWLGAGQAELTVRSEGGTETLSASSGGYCRIERVWRGGDEIRLELPMSPRLLACHPFVEGNLGRAALQRGPLIYCIEQADHTECDVRILALDGSAPITPRSEPELLNGVTVLECAGAAACGDRWNDALYQPAIAAQVESRRTGLTAIPYYAWANRTAGAMLVWIPVT